MWLKHTCVAILLTSWMVCASAQAQTFPRGRDVEALVGTRGVARRGWNAIIIHHTATTAGSAASIDASHRGVRHMPRGLAYHFVIGNGHGLGDGEIEVGPRWTRQQPGAHVASALRDAETHALWDEVAIGICLVGNFESSSPTAAQLEALKRLVGVLRRRFHIAGDRVLGHGEVPGAHTACPGRALRPEVLRIADRPSLPPPARISTVKRRWPMRGTRRAVLPLSPPRSAARPGDKINKGDPATARRVPRTNKPGVPRTNKSRGARSWSVGTG